MRAREVSSAQDLLRLALVYGATPLSLRATAAWAEAAGLARLSDVALLGRLQASCNWLGAIVQALLSTAIVPMAAPTQRRLRLVDATTISSPGGSRWRLHSDYELARNRFIGLALSDQHEAESLEHFTVRAGDIFVADRLYAKARQLQHVLAGGGDFLVRRGLTGCTLRRPDGEAFDLHAILAALDTSGVLDLPVLIPGPLGSADAAMTGRLIIRHLGEKAEAARERSRRKARKAGQKASAKRLKAAEYIMLLTSLEVGDFPAERILELYRLRWQIEIAFKRLKSLAGLADLAAKEPRLVKACLYAKLILALLSEDMLQQLLDSPPWDNVHTAIPLAPATAAA